MGFCSLVRSVCLARSVKWREKRISAAIFNVVFSKELDLLGLLLIQSYAKHFDLSHNDQP